MILRPINISLSTLVVFHCLFFQLLHSELFVYVFMIMIMLLLQCACVRKLKKIITYPALSNYHV